MYVYLSIVETFELYRNIFKELKEAKNTWPVVDL